MGTLNFNDFLKFKIWESENEPIVFKGKPGDPYQYKIEGGKFYYIKYYKNAIQLVDKNDEGWILADSGGTREKAIKALADELGIKYSLDFPGGEKGEGEGDGDGEGKGDGEVESGTGVKSELKSATQDVSKKEDSGSEKIEKPQDKKQYELTRAEKERYEELQRELNRSKPFLPKLWVLPLTVDGNPQWRTAYALFEFFSSVSTDLDFTVFSHSDFTSFKETAKNSFDTNDGTSVKTYTEYDGEKYETGVEYPTNVINPYGIETAKDIVDAYISAYFKGNIDLLIETIRKKNDWYLGKYTSGEVFGEISFGKFPKSASSPITADYLMVHADKSPIKSIPKDSKINYVVVSSDTATPFKVPKIESQVIVCCGQVVLEEGWTEIGELKIKDNIQYQDGCEEATGYKPLNPNIIPSTLKKFRALTVSSKTFTKLPDGITIGSPEIRIEPINIKALEISKSDVIAAEVASQITSGEGKSSSGKIEVGGNDGDKKTKIQSTKVPWIKRLFSKNKSKYQYIEIKESYSPIFESEGLGFLDIVGCEKITKLPKDLVINGDFWVYGSGIYNNFKGKKEDIETYIKENCTITGKIFITPYLYDDEDEIEIDVNQN